MSFQFALPEYAEELTMPAKDGLRLDKEDGLFPCADHPGQKHQEKPIRLAVDGSFHLSTKVSSCCRSRAFSASSSNFPLVRSVRVPSKREIVGGLIKRRKRS